MTHGSTKITKVGAVDDSVKLLCHLMAPPAVASAVGCRNLIWPCTMLVCGSRLPQFDLAVYCASMRQALHPSCKAAPAGALLI
jgi:hypothetical protein